jgi:hypothetical protein
MWTPNPILILLSGQVNCNTALSQVIIESMYREYESLHPTRRSVEMLQKNAVLSKLQFRNNKNI